MDSYARAIELVRRNNIWVGSFNAMAGPCELLMDFDDRALASHLLSIAFHEARRIERKYSRYRSDNIVHRINSGDGDEVDVDAETALLLDYADRCFQLSEGRFDITSGVLREVWRFDGSDNVPTAEAVAALLPRIGWQKVRWVSPRLQMPAGMEIDFGGIGKEYAVDRTALLLRQHVRGGLLINYGGDLCALGPRRDDTPWEVAIEVPDDGKAPHHIIYLKSGAVATSGDARRFLLKGDVRYGHILNPLNGWPVPDAPRSVTTIGSTCMEAGMLSTFAILHGAGAELFLQEQQLEYLCIW